MAGPIDDDFTVDPQKAMRGVGVFYLPFDAFLSGKRWRRREQGRQDECAISHVLHYHTVRAPRLFVSFETTCAVNFRNLGGVYDGVDAPRRQKWRWRQPSSVV